MQTFFIAPTDFGVGLTSISLGLVRTLERAGLKVGFFKPIAQPHPGDTGPERSTELVARTHGITPAATEPGTGRAHARRRPAGRVARRNHPPLPASLRRQ